MSYSEEKIKKYQEILNNYTSKPNDESNLKAKCCACENSTNFTIDYGYKICDECGVGFYDNKDFDRLHYRKKSVYKRKYHYEKKVNQISKRIKLTNEQKNELYSKSMMIDNHIMEILNKEYNRKRMISIVYLIKKLLAEMGCEKYKLVYLKISPQTLDNYENWWDSYKSLKTG